MTLVDSGRGTFLLNFVQFLLIALWVLVFGRVLMSWVDPTGATGSVPDQATEPILAPVRRMLPRRDDRLVEFVVLIVLGFLWRAF